MLWLIAIAGAALCFMAPGLNDPYQMPRLLALAALCVPLLLRPSSRKSALEPAAWLLILVWVLAAMVSRDTSASLLGSYLAPFDGMVAVAVYVGLLVGVARLEASVEDAAAAICWASLPLSAYAIAQHVAPDPLLRFMEMSLPSSRVIAFQGSPVYLGAVLAIVAAVAAALIGGARHRTAALTLALAVPALWFTQTRGAMLAAGLGAAFLMSVRARWTLLAASLLLLLHPRLYVVNSDLGRIEIWREALAMFRTHPLLGTGPGTFEIVSRAFITPAYITAQHNASMVSQSAHNLVLQVMATTGLAGLAGMTCLILSAWRVYREAGEVRGILGTATIAFAVVAAVNPVPHSAIVLMAMLFGAASGRWVLGGESADPSLASWISEHREYSYAAMAAVSFFLAGRVAVGDYHYVQAIKIARGGDAVEAANRMSLAARANPWDLRIVARRIDSALALMPTMRPADRRTVAGACLDWAAEGVLAHPNDPLAHEIMGRSILIAVSLGMQQTPLEAMAAFKAGQALAPTFPQLMMRRRALARALGQEDEARGADRELERITTWERGGA